VKERGKRSPLPNGEKPWTQSRIGQTKTLLQLATQQKGFHQRPHAAVKGVTATITRGRAKLKEEANADLQVNLLWTTSPQQKISFVEECCSPTVVSIQRKEIISLLQAAAGFTLSCCASFKQVSTLDASNVDVVSRAHWSSLDQPELNVTW
jgi:hypothetical protein